MLLLCQLLPRPLPAAGAVVRRCCNARCWAPSTTGPEPVFFCHLDDCVAVLSPSAPVPLIAPFLQELFETLSQCLLSGAERDALSGWGAVVHVITKDQVVTRTLKTRMD